MKLLSIVVFMISSLVASLPVVAQQSLPDEERQKQAAMIAKFEKQDITREQLKQVMDNDIVIGNIDAPVTLIEYASLSCTHCADFHENVVTPLKDTLIKDGTVRYVLRDFPLNLQAVRASMLTRCRDGVDVYLKIVDVLFKTQNSWAFKKNYLEILANIAKLSGMSTQEFEACMADEELEMSVIASKYFGAKKLEVRSTPTVYINGKVYQGARKLEAVKAKLMEAAQEAEDAQTITDEQEDANADAEQ